ncbi:MAG: flagellar biosynthesis protein FlhA [Pseudomonadota bacterium]
MRKDIALIFLILAILALIIVPLGPTMLDILLSVNLTFAVLLLIVAVYLKHPADFPTFPTVILLGTALRLALSIATTRQILSEADAGQIIETFGSFVIGGNIAIGLIVFLIITVFQFLVVTKGAERVAEVSARFALDAMPGKQMSIDADLRAENIDKAEAARRREKLERESQFFGSMDGAMKFVKGDAIAGLIIIFINLVGGISVGMLYLGFTFEQAVATFTLLTLGDGLVAQLPALLMALCAGIVTTRVDGKNNVDLGTDIWRDLISDPRVPAAAAGIVVLIGLIPGFPLINFAVAAGVLLVVSLSMRQYLRMSEAHEEAASADTKSAEKDQPKGDTSETLVVPAQAGAVDDKRSDRIHLLIGGDLADELDQGQIDTLLRQLLARYAESRALKFEPPSVVIIRDNPKVARLFQVTLDDVPLVNETVPENSVLVRCDQAFLDMLGCGPEEVTRVRWHEFGGYWIPQSYAKRAEEAQCQPQSVETHFATVAFRIYETNVGTLFDHAHYDAFMAQLASSNPVVHKEVQERADRVIFFQTLRFLAEDGVPLRPAALIADSFLTWLQTHGTASALELSEFIRATLKRQICHALSAERGVLGVVLLDPAIEGAAREAIDAMASHDSPASADGLPLTADVSEGILRQLHDFVAGLVPEEPTPVVIATAPFRRRMRNYLSANRVMLPVLAPHELSPEINVHPLVRITMPQSARAH